MRTEIRLMLYALPLAALACSAPDSAQAQALRGFDGQWSVLVITEAGTCDRAYRYPVRIARGRVGHADPANTSFNISGRISAGGAVRVSVSRGDKRADGIGRLTRAGGGGGTWKSSRGECSGRWTAERRGI